MLTDETKDQLTGGISTSILSQTFRDAISVAKYLEIQYIWIDSLCIFQDSKQDWEEQAPLMDEVFSHAFLCIAATASAKSSSGLFRTREASSRVTCEVTTSWSDRPNGVYQIYNQKIWPNAFEDQPLMTRAWVVQELQLPSRILYFNSNQIFWQCFDRLACEELPTHINADRKTVRQQQDKFEISSYDYYHRASIGDRASPMIRTNHLIELWRLILEQYTNCRLTFSRDKLVAISGLARLFCEPLSDTYCAGLWVRRMPIELLWKRGILDLPKLALPKSMQACYRAPSWSWASIDEPVTPITLHNEASVVILVEIKSCYAITKTGDAFSEVLNGVIRLSGFLSEMQLQPVADSEFGIYWNVIIDGVWLDAGVGGRPRVVLDYQPPDSQELFCLPIVLWKSGIFTWDLECLLLGAIEGKKDTYERFGRLTIPVKRLLADHRRSELGGVDNKSIFADKDSHVEVQSRGSAWHHFILSWSKHCTTYPQGIVLKDDDSLEYETIAVPGAVEISIE